MSPGVTGRAALVITSGHRGGRSGHQPQPRHEALVGEHRERPLLRCVELQRGGAGRSPRRRVGRLPGRDARHPEQHPDDALPARAPANLAAVAVDHHGNRSLASSIRSSGTLGGGTDSFGALCGEEAGHPDGERRQLRVRRASSTAEGTLCAPCAHTDPTTALSEVTTTTGRPFGSLATRARITSSASTPGSLNSTRTPREPRAGGTTTPAPSNTSVISTPVRAASAASCPASRARWSASGSSG